DGNEDVQRHAGHQCGVLGPRPFFGKAVEYTGPADPDRGRTDQHAAKAPDQARGLVQTCRQAAHHATCERLETAHLDCPLVRWNTASEWTGRKSRLLKPSPYSTKPQASRRRAVWIYVSIVLNRFDDRRITARNKGVFRTKPLVSFPPRLPSPDPRG